MEQNDIMQARKERILAYIKSDEYIPMKRRDLRVMMDVPQEDRPLFEELLQQLIDEGHIFETRKGVEDCLGTSILLEILIKFCSEFIDIFSFIEVIQCKDQKQLYFTHIGHLSSFEMIFRTYARLSQKLCLG